MKKALIIVPFALLVVTIAGWFVLERATNPTADARPAPPPSSSPIDEPKPSTAIPESNGEQEELDRADVESSIADETGTGASSIPQPRWRESAAKQLDRPKQDASGARSGPVDAASSEPGPREGGKTQPGGRTGQSNRSNEPASTNDTSRTTTRSVPTPIREGDSDRPNPTRDPDTDRINDPTSDTEAPTVVSIEFSPPQIQDGESTTILIAATDDLSGVKFVTGSVRSPSASAVIGFSAASDGTNERFIGTIKVPEKADAGEWHVNQIRAMDKANNVRSVSWDGSSAPPGARFRVVSANADSTPPTVESIALDREAVNAGEANVIRIAVTDDESGVNAVNGMFSSPSGRATASFQCTLDSGSGLWVGNIALPVDADCGEWVLRHLSVSDKANNRATLGADQPVIRDTKFFLSFEGSCDSEPPIVTLVQFDPTAIINTEANLIRVIVLVEDDATGVKHVSGRLIGPSGTDGQPPTISFGLKPTADARRWEGTFTMPALAAKGWWSLQKLDALDNANNRRNYSQTDRVLQGIGVTVQ